MAGQRQHPVIAIVAAEVTALHDSVRADGHIDVFSIQLLCADFQIALAAITIAIERE